MRLTGVAPGAVILPRIKSGACEVVKRAGSNLHVADVGLGPAVQELPVEVQPVGGAGRYQSAAENARAPNPVRLVEAVERCQSAVDRRRAVTRIMTGIESGIVFLERRATLF